MSGYDSASNQKPKYPFAITPVDSDYSDELSRDFPGKYWIRKVNGEKANNKIDWTITLQRCCGWICARWPEKVLLHGKISRLRRTTVQFPSKTRWHMGGHFSTFGYNDNPGIGLVTHERFWLRTCTTTTTTGSLSIFLSNLSHLQHWTTVDLWFSSHCRSFLRDGSDANIDRWQSKTQRLFETHFPFSLLPPSIMKVKAKVIYVARHAKDVAVSLYYLNKNSKCIKFSSELAQFWDYFERGCASTSYACDPTTIV